jgi:hypothetical protein
MDKHDHFPWIGLDIIEELLKLGAFGDLLPSCASLVVLKKDWLWQATKLTGFSDSPLLCVYAIVILLHLTGTPDIACHKNT